MRARKPWRIVMAVLEVYPHGLLIQHCLVRASHFAEASLAATRCTRPLSAPLRCSTLLPAYITAQMARTPWVSFVAGYSLAACAGTAGFIAAAAVEARQRTYFMRHAAKRKEA
jgi:hypothetical protein